MIEKDKEIIKRIMKTKEERMPNLSAELEEHKQSVIKESSMALKAEREAEKEKKKMDKIKEAAKKQEWDELAEK